MLHHCRTGSLGIWKDFRTSIFLWHRIAENQLENATYALYQQSQGR